MKYILLSLIALLSGCGGTSDNTTLMDLDLSGTWLRKDYIDYYDTNTQSIVYSEYSQSTHFLDDPLNGAVNIARCVKYDGVNWDIITKNVNNINIFSRVTDYVKVNKNSLVLNDTHIPDINFPNIEQRVTSYFDRVSTNILLDSGSILINGPINKNESSHVCIRYASSDRDGSEAFIISTPHQGGFLSISLITRTPLNVISYLFDRNVTNDIVNFDINYGIDEEISFNSIMPSIVTVDITSNTDFGYDGTFSFTDNNSNSYTGLFEINTPY